MKTENYHPSSLETQFARALLHAKDELDKNLKGLRILEMQPILNTDDPVVVLRLIDEDGDLHELVLQIIQRPDGFVKGAMQ